MREKNKDVVKEEGTLTIRWEIKEKWKQIWTLM